MKSVKGIHIQFFLLVLGVISVSVSYLVSNWYMWVPLQVAARFDERNTIVKSFTTDVAANHVIEVMVERRIPFIEINCMLGIGDAVANTCATDSSRISIAWELRSSSTGRMLATGNSSEEKGGAWGDTISRIIGHFRAEKGSTYELRIKSDTTKFLPSSLNPKILVRVDPLTSKSYFLVAGILQWTGLLLILLAFALIIFMRTGKIMQARME